MNLFNGKKPNTPKQDRAHNPQNGNDAEKLASSMLVLACQAEIRWGFREEDGDKIDLFLSCEHPWYLGERLIILVQIKSGKSYGEQKKDGFLLKKNAKIAAQRTSHPICIVWVNRESTACFWAYVHPNSNDLSQEYGLHHSITPAMLFDLARCSGKYTLKSRGGGGIIVRKRTTHLTQRRKNVKSSYRQIAQEGILSPVLGNIELTRLGWRHMLRKSRASKHKEASLNTIPYLKRFLEQLPSSHAILSVNYLREDGFVYRSVEHLLKYEKAKINVGSNNNNSVPRTFLFKILETVRYPEAWTSEAHLSQKVERRVVLKNAYYKEQH
ncbi:hypothetical protein IQ265_28045 [Nodosilinea sp. LEGE 06152]|uniref:hypothetical protein n=1 Tax=Nodosilinea sp. LEGE 06152 TaxID=2777966 RepID=UPI00187FCAAF|nr:hypothetical protein [Nodosilinea sp. LEGE 06152]MBE9158203.1 hypothetical protein [Nodosilinea sp. LEGE 06152]MBE9160644.1 hypothetical protein [Nodosilinea sp. LEGE 06152]